MSSTERTERERFAAPRIEHDPDVERRDRIREIARLRAINQSPWAIGVSHWNQRDLYTRNGRIDEQGYGRGPTVHPEEGSYAYHRDFSRREAPESHGATLPEREAWPWLNYHSAEEDPYFAHLNHAARHDSFWEKLKGGVAGLFHVGAERAPKNAARPDARLLEEVNDALTYRGDLDATDIDVTVHGAAVTLSGTVTDHRSKRVAEEICEGVIGVRDVRNRLTIRQDDPTDANVAFVLPLTLLGGY